ncbi:laccase-like multicopper oxidase [Cenococcum geophilum 1.58]|uniref:laccase-like multicopper oxidase n=1 Tax=Cenococcum geophilum 1.58 TaxID=794803 RepID=UPI00358FB72E|nr:laccase-like multicopper oxidase [Cenococcum geophilum 1.58]
MRVVNWSLALCLAGALPAIAGKDTSKDGKCGNGVSCWGSIFGDCCSSSGACGSTKAHCGSGCQEDNGWCDSKQKRGVSSSTASPTATATALSCPSSNGTIFTATSGDAYQVECFLDHVNGDMSGNPVYTSGLAGCIAACEARTGCVDVSWVPGSPQGPCYLKSKVGSPVSAGNVWGAIRVYPVTTGTATSYAQPTPTSTTCPSINNTVYTSSCGAAFLIECSTDHAGGDLPGGGFYVPNVEACAASCAATPGCVDVSWVAGTPQGPCYLKKSVGKAVSVSNVHGAILIANCTTASSTVSSTTTKVSGSASASSSSVSLTSISVSSSASVSSSSVSLTSTSVSSSASVSATITSASSTASSSAESTSSVSITSSANLTTSASSSTITSSANFTSVSTTSVNATTTTSSNSTSVFSCTTKPTSTALCIPCEGQPGVDPNNFCGFDINTDYYENVPKTCKTVTYTFDITNTTISPDGIERVALLVNGQMPGPAIEANWGDTIVVTVNNKLTNNGTSIHFHGIRQNLTSEYDGVPSITQCPIAPGESMTYTWVATNYGTSWYHSHFAIQAWMGVQGPMIIHGPTSQSYDVDAGMIVLQDWSHATVDSMYDAAQDAVAGGPRKMDNGLINGQNTWGNGTSSTGSRFVLDTQFISGQSYLLRIVNTAIQSTYKFYIDGHSMTVISNDFVPITPYETKILNINIGQRYNVIVKADQPIGDYWMRSDNQNACAATIQALDIKGIVRYVGSPGATPTTTGYNYTGGCVDEPIESLVPIVALNAADDDTEFTYGVTVAPNSANLFKWYLSGTTFESQYGDPTLFHLVENGTAPTYSGNLILDIPEAKQWVYIIVESGIPVPHPIHLHGHDFNILAAGAGSYDSTVALNLQNPARRDTALLPAAGFIVLAFLTDNPGVWLMHCHVGWHTSMGFALQIVEQKSKILGTVADSCALQNTCSTWDDYATANGIEVHDSGV